MRRVLIVESNPLFREKIMQIIADNFESMMTCEAYGESEALDEISRHAFDVAILDLELSDGNGFNLLKKIKLLTPDMPVLGMSMFPVKQYEESVLKEGAYGYISKANLSNELIVALQEVFKGEKYIAIRDTYDPGGKL